MDEQRMVSEGETIKIHQDIIDRDNRDLTFWTDKHNRYASREVLDVLTRSPHWTAVEGKRRKR